MDYRKEIIKLLHRIEDEKYLKYVYTLLITFLDDNC